jgi:hypothetical protein
VRIRPFACSLDRDEQPAVRTLEAAVARRGCRQQLRVERLLAVRTNDVAFVVGGGLRHATQRTSAVGPRRREPARDGRRLTTHFALDATFSTGTVLFADGGYTAH